MAICTALAAAPFLILSATTLGDDCYYCMFAECSSLISVPQLPATTLASNCYSFMFRDCTSLTTAPELPATTLVDSCYNFMFYNCSSLSYIKALFTTNPGSSYTNYWVYGVSYSNLSIYVKNENATYTTRGYSAIPSSWTVEIWEDLTDVYNLKNTLENENVEEQYFSIRAHKDGIIYWTKYSTSSNNLLYSKDNGTTWIETSATDSISVNKYDDVIFKGQLTPKGGYTYSVSTKTGIGNFYFTNKVSVYGNIMSLIYGDDFLNKTEFSDQNNTNFTYVFEGLFNPTYRTGNSSSSITYLISADNLILPATTLSDFCYVNMFKNCSKIIDIPELPATTLTKYCYYSMFMGCSKLTEVYKLPATTLAENCYYGMFQSCTSLTTIPSDLLPATTLETKCYSSMFQNCTSLTTVPSDLLPATTLAHGCYQNMFKKTKLIVAPELPATTVPTYCYEYMFDSCTSLTTPPELPATTLDTCCYENMFNGCTSLTNSPELPATTMASSCYSYMFNSCSNLNYIKCLSIVVDENNYTYNWVENVSPTGTFVKNINADWELGPSGIPIGWNISSLGILEKDLLTFKAEESGSAIGLKSLSDNQKLEYSIDTINWEEMNKSTVIVLSDVGDKVYVYAGSSAYAGRLWRRAAK